MSPIISIRYAINIHYLDDFYIRWRNRSNITKGENSMYLLSEGVSQMELFNDHPEFETFVIRWLLRTKHLANNKRAINGFRRRLRCLLYLDDMKSREHLPAYFEELDWFKWMYQLGFGEIEKEIEGEGGA
jgi:hypothetical protein